MIKKLALEMVFVLIVVGLIVFLSITPQKTMDEYTKYECDVKNFRLSTTIEIDKEGEKFAEVNGNLFKFVTDPLTMYDLNGEKIAYASDEYHIIAQDSHAIFVNGEIAVEMVGLFDLWGEKYDIYDSEGQKIATVKFNYRDSNGEMYDMDGNLIADYSSFVFFNDYDVRISEECNLDEKTVLMIFASYYSDQAYDSN